jgi:hypothetical protein
MRIGYADEESYPGQFELYRANTERQIAGRKGQKALRDLEEALLALPSKRLVLKHLAERDGGVCAIGALLVLKRQRAGMSYDDAVRDIIATHDCDSEPDTMTDEVAVAEGVAPPLVAWRLVELNDVLLESFWDTEAATHVKPTPEERYERVLAWVRSQLVSTETP